MDDKFCNLGSQVALTHTFTQSGYYDWEVLCAQSWENKHLMLITKKLVYQAMHDDDWFHMHRVNRMTRHVQATNPQPAEGGYTYRVCSPGSPSRISFYIHERSDVVMLLELSLKNVKICCNSAVSKIYSLTK